MKLYRSSSRRWTTLLLYRYTHTHTHTHTHARLHCQQAERETFEVSHAEKRCFCVCLPSPNVQLPPHRLRPQWRRRDLNPPGARRRKLPFVLSLFLLQVLTFTQSRHSSTYSNAALCRDHCCYNTDATLLYSSLFIDDMLSKCSLLLLLTVCTLSLYQFYWMNEFIYFYQQNIQPPGI